MGAKLYADTATKTLMISATPDGDGFIDIDVREDVWSDLIEDWESTLGLRKHTFPVVAIGGQEISAGKLGTTFVLLDPWHMHPYEGDHTLNINGNLFTELATTHLVAPTLGTYTVTVNRNLSTLVEVIESGTSGLTPAESQALIDIDSNVDTLITATAALEAKIDTLIASQDLTNEQQAAEHLTDPVNGLVILRNTDTTTRWEADAWEDFDRTQRYRGEGLEAVGMLAEVAWS